MNITHAVSVGKIHKFTGYAVQDSRFTEHRGKEYRYSLIEVFHSLPSKRDNRKDERSQTSFR